MRYRVDIVRMVQQYGHVEIEAVSEQDARESAAKYLAQRLLPATWHEEYRRGPVEIVKVQEAAA